MSKNLTESLKKQCKELEFYCSENSVYVIFDKKTFNCEEGVGPLDSNYESFLNYFIDVLTKSEKLNKIETSQYILLKEQLNAEVKESIKSVTTEHDTSMQVIKKYNFPENIYEIIKPFFNNSFEYFPFFKSPCKSTGFRTYRRTNDYRHPCVEVTPVYIKHTDGLALLTSLMDIDLHFWLFRISYNNYRMAAARAGDTPLSMDKYMVSVFNKFISDFTFNTIPGEPKPVSSSPNTFTFKYIDPQIYVDGDIPAWDEFLNRLSDKKSFMLWVGSLYTEDTDYIRQILWLNGEGNDGKSVIMNAICNDFKVFSGCNVTDLKNDHFYAQVYGKSMLLCADCKTPSLISNDKIHAISGGDNVMVNPKHMQQFPAYIHMKICITSNSLPQISKERNEITRLIPIICSEAKENTPGWKASINREIPHFIFKCRELFKKEITDKNLTLINVGFESEQFQQCISSDDTELEDFFEDNFIFNENAYIKVNYFNDIINPYIKEHALIKGLKNKINRQLRLRGVVSNVRIRSGSSRFRVHKGLTHIKHPSYLTPSDTNPLDL